MSHTARRRTIPVVAPITGNGNFMTWTGSIGGIPVEVTLQRR